mgnify:FL=1
MVTNLFSCSPPKEPGRFCISATSFTFHQLFLSMHVVQLISPFAHAYIFFFQVSWNIVESAFRGEVEPSQGIITFAPGESEKDLIIRLKNDNVSSFAA